MQKEQVKRGLCEGAPTQCEDMPGLFSDNSIVFRSLPVVYAHWLEVNQGRYSGIKLVGYFHPSVIAVFHPPIAALPQFREKAVLHRASEVSSGHSRDQAQYAQKRVSLKFFNPFIYVPVCATSHIPVVSPGTKILYLYPFRIFPLYFSVIF